MQISFGGLPASNKPSSGGRDNFVGCMEGIVYNGDNITSLIRRKKVDTSSFVRTTALVHPSGGLCGMRGWDGCVCVCTYVRLYERKRISVCVSVRVHVFTLARC